MYLYMHANIQAYAHMQAYIHRHTYTLTCCVPLLPCSGKTVPVEGVDLSSTRRVCSIA